MRLLCLNANTTPFITKIVGDEMRRTLGDAVEVVDCTPTFGPAVINSRVDVAVASHAIVDAAAHHTDVDAIMLAVSFDIGRDALREALSIPVVGMTEAAIAVARMHGRNIGYISMGERLTPLYHETLTHCDIKFDLAGWQAIEVPSAYQAGETAELDAAVCGACETLAKQGADVVVLLGAVVAGVAFRVKDSVPVPVVDGGSAGALMARMLVDIGLPKAKSGSFSRGNAGKLQGVSDALFKL